MVNGGETLSILMRQAVQISPWSVGAIFVATLTAACATQAPVYQAVRAPNANTLGAPHFISAPPSQCVPYARARSGIELFGDADVWWSMAGAEGYPRSYTPRPGAVMVLQVGTEGDRGHLAFVQRVVSSREIIVDHANWHGHREVAVNVPVIDVSPRNDWSEVRVFWLETGQMGARTYPVEGFVLPLHFAGA